LYQQKKEERMVFGIRILATVMLLAALCSGQEPAKPTQADGSDTQYPARDYSTISLETYRDGQNKPARLKSVRVRFAKADGQNKQLIVSASGKITIRWAKLDGIFFGEPGKLYQQGEFTKPPEIFRSAKFYRGHSEFKPTESRLGYQTYVNRRSAENGAFLEAYMSPELGFQPLKAINHMSDGAEIVMEVIKLDFTQTTDQMLTDESRATASRYVAEAMKAAESQGRKEFFEDLKLMQKRLQAR
jgi:hypothetical protein